MVCLVFIGHSWINQCNIMKVHEPYSFHSDSTQRALHELIGEVIQQCTTYLLRLFRSYSPALVDVSRFIPPRASQNRARERGSKRAIVLWIVAWTLNGVNAAAECRHHIEWVRTQMVDHSHRKVSSVNSMVAGSVAAVVHQDHPGRAHPSQATRSKFFSSFTKAGGETQGCR